MAYEIYHSPLLSAMEARGDDQFLHGEDYDTDEAEEHYDDYDTLREALDAIDGIGTGVYRVFVGETLLGFAVSAHAPTFAQRLWWYPTDGAPVSAQDVGTFELANRIADGTWSFVGDYTTFAEAVERAKELAGLQPGNVHLSDDGTFVFGISADPKSGSYEHTLEIDEESGSCVHLEAGSIVGTI